MSGGRPSISRPHRSRGAAEELLGAYAAVGEMSIIWVYIIFNKIIFNYIHILYCYNSYGLFPNLKDHLLLLYHLPSIPNY